MRTSLKDGVVVTVPRRFSRRRLKDILLKERRLLDDAWARLERKKQDLEVVRPERVRLPALSEEWAVQYEFAELAGARARENGSGRLVVSGGEEWFASVQGWLQAKAKDRLVPWLRRVSEAKGLPFRSAGVRAQRSRWASCSAKKSISLNQKLLFLEPELVEYVFVHELCHTVQMNHSARFWAEVERYEPDARRLRRDIRAAEQTVPQWWRLGREAN
ncbi:MAG: DUF45 domain-containing protein [Chloroflexi bacterium]|nr:DUF45 domain-containing protein [Chloroflexota bacterium]